MTNVTPAGDATCIRCGHQWRVSLTRYASEHGSALAEHLPHACPECGSMYWHHNNPNQKDNNR